MIPDVAGWVTAGTAVTAVMGGLLGVYTSTQSRIDVADERMANTIEILERLTVAQGDMDEKLLGFQERLVKNEVSAAYLKEGQDRLHSTMSALTGEMRNLNATLTAN